MLILICTCGHYGALPDESLSLKCSQCGRRGTFTWFESWAAWRAEVVRRIFAREDAPAFHVEWRATSGVRG
jgi:hypothetical protein